MFVFCSFYRVLSSFFLSYPILGGRLGFNLKTFCTSWNGLAKGNPVQGCRSLIRMRWASIWACTGTVLEKMDLDDVDFLIYF
jgi:hypothetical protein